MNILKKWRIYIVYCSMLVVYSCNTNKKNIPDEFTGAIFSNNIRIHSKNADVKSAILRSDDGEKIADDNTVNLNEKIHLELIMRNKWKIVKNKSYVGASEKITTNDGILVLDVPDLFAKYDEDGIDPEDAKILSLSAMITNETPSIKYYNVDFRVWDKKGDGEVTGNYKFYIRH